MILNKLRKKITEFALNSMVLKIYLKIMRMRACWRSSDFLNTIK